MEENAEKLKLLGAFGIVAESIRILRCCQQIMGAITLALVLSLSLAALLHTLISLPLSAILLSDELNSLTSEDVNDRREFHWQLPVFIVYEMVYGVSVCALSGLLTAAMASTMASIYSGKQEPSLAKLQRILLTTWKRMLITFIVLWKLACVVCVVDEECYGLDGLKKSLCLMDGKDSIALMLPLMCLITEYGFIYAVVRVNWDAVDFEGSNAFGAILVLLECGVVLMGPLTQSILYFLSTSYHGENIDKLWLVD